MSQARFPAKKSGLPIVVLLMLFQGWFAVKLNADFYLHHIPFFDSCAYTNQLAAISATVRSQGLSAGIKSALKRNVALPWLEEALLARFAEPSRFTGIFLQWIWLTLFALSVYWYFVQYRKVSLPLAICLTLPFISFARIYDWDGGLPDFRMDLSLYTFLSLTSVWYLVTYETESAVPWLLAGLSAMLACVGRATASVYLVVTLAPLLVVRLWRTPAGRRVRLLRNCVWMALPLGIGLLYQVFNFKYLYFYYVTWRGDPLSGLPLSRSVMHVVLAGTHLGIVMALCSLVVLAINFRAGIARQFRQIDWRIFWLAGAAPLFLMLQGAGLNPFVSMPAVFGMLLFCYFPARYHGMNELSRSARWAVCFLLAGSSLFNAALGKGPQLLTGPNETRMDGMRTLIERMHWDTSAQRRREVRYIIPEIGDFHACALQNVLIYEYGGTPTPDGGIHLPSGLQYSFPREEVFTFVNEGFWERDVPGKTDDQKMASMTSLAAQLPDYLLLPTPNTLDFLERYSAPPLVNLKVRRLKERLLSTGRWKQFGDPIEISPYESIELYSRNVVK